MDRRDAVKYMSILLGGTFIGAEAFLSGCKSNTGKATDWSEDDIAYLNEIGETILPQTATPGAKAANVGKFMTIMVNDCYEEADQKVFHDGMRKINDAAKDKYSKGFMDLAPQQRHDLLVGLDKEAKTQQQKVEAFNQGESAKETAEIAKGNLKYKRQYMSPHYFALMKQLTMLGFFTSEVGATKAIRYFPVPGRYDGCIDYKKGDKLFI